ncbi:TolB family protein [Dactylosporangium sp. CA-092794]|uniref:TolB family protein n=1 Tax=Dactylosporangium sp. CA-092794 TaxID=3239929 RepID=UPI003D8ECF7E
MRAHSWGVIARGAVAVTAALTLTAASCSGEPPAKPAGADPSQPGPALRGTLLVYVESEVVTVTGTAERPVVTTIASDVRSAALSPDLRTLAYVSGTGRLLLRDVAGGTDKPLAVQSAGQPLTPENACMAWSPDSQRLAAFAGDNALYVIATDGAATMVDAPKSARYVKVENKIFLRPDPADPGVQVTSEITCPAWLDARRLVFDRVAAMPEQITESERAGAHVSTDTTTIADLSAGPVRLSDTQSRWGVSGTCGDRLITHNTDNARFLVNSAALTGPDAATPAGGALPKATEHGFIPGTCDVLLIDEAAGHDTHPARRYGVTTGALTELPAIGADAGAPPRLDPRFTAWQPGATVFAWGGSYARDGSVRTLRNKIALHDLASGRRSTIAIGTDDRRWVKSILGWLPPDQRAAG